MARQAKAAPPNDLAPSGAGPTESGAATRHLFIVWKADGSPAPDKLEKGAAPYLIPFHRGCMRANSRQHAAALDFFQSAIDLNPDFAEAHCNLGVAFAKLGRRSRALTEFAIAVSLNSKFFLAASNLWMLLRGDELSRKLQDAVGSLEPDYDEPQDNLGQFADRLLTHEQWAKERKTLARTGPLAKYMATNEHLTRALETLALTQHNIGGHGAAKVGLVLEAFDLWLTPGLIGRISEEEAKHVEAQQTFGFPERPAVPEPDYVDWDEVKRFYSKQENPDFVFGERPLEQRQNSDLVSDETMQNGLVPGATTTPAQARGKPGLRHRPPLPEAGHEVTRPAETQPHPVSDEARILSDLPASLRGRGYVKRNKPEDPETVKKAYRAANGYDELKKQGHEFDGAEMAAVRAGWRVKQARYRRNRKARGQTLTRS